MMDILCEDNNSKEEFGQEKMTSMAGSGKNLIWIEEVIEPGWP